MIKFKTNPVNTLSVAIVLDRSSSMHGHRNDVVKSLNQQIANFKEESKKSAIPTDISLVSFADVASKDFLYIKTEDTGDIDPASYYPAGSTALYDGIMTGIGVLRSSSGLRKLLLIITDGEENVSKLYSRLTVSNEIRNLISGENWTIAACVPPGTKGRVNTETGIEYGSIAEWERTTRGIEEATRTITRSTTSLYSSYNAGATRSAGFFQPDLNNLAPTVVQTNLNEVTGNYQVLPVQTKEPIASFVARTTNRPYRVGASFYQLTKKEKVQASKDIMIRDKNGKIFGGSNARSLLRIPAGGDIELNPASNNEYEVYVKSTSHNRNLVPNTNVLVQK